MYRRPVLQIIGYVRPADAGKSYAYKLSGKQAKQSGGGFGAKTWALLVRHPNEQFPGHDISLEGDLDKDGPYWVVWGKRNARHDG